jgi:uncharacterized lipoprotein YajG
MTHYKTMNVLALLTLPLLVTGCAKTQTVYKTNTVYLTPPAFLLTDCTAPEYTGTTWTDVADHALQLKAELSLCNWDKRQLREWAVSNLR